MFVINGKDVIVFIGDLPIFCGKDCTFSEDKEIIPASTVTSGVWKEFRLRKRSWAVQVNGLTKINNTDGQQDYFDLIGSTALDVKDVRITFTDLDSNIKTIEGNGYIEKSSITGPATAFAEPSLLIAGDGLYTVT